METRTHPHPPSPWTAGAWMWFFGLSIILPAIVSMTVFLLASSWRDDLPDPVLMDWGPINYPVDYASVGAALQSILTWGPIVGGLTFAATGVVARKAEQPWVMPFCVGTSAGLGAFVPSLMGGTLFFQRGITDPANELDDALSLAVVTVALTVGAIIGLVAARLTHSRRPDPPADRATTTQGSGHGAGTVGDVDGSSMSWSRHVLTPVPVIALLLGIVGPPVVLIAVIGLPWWLLLIPFVAWAGIVWSVAARVTIDSTGLRIAPPWPATPVRQPLDSISSVRVIDVSPFRDSGGWGWRGRRQGGAGLVLRSGPAIEVESSTGRRLVVTVPDAHQGAEVLTWHMGER